jgi:spore coat polysaccharide biosynthesis protein SpsF
MSSNLVVIQARMNSTRFPGKVLADLHGEPMIKYQIERVKSSQEVNQIVVATSTEESDNELSDYLNSVSQPVFRGPLNNVLLRFLQVLDTYNPSYFIRITGDCPLVMPDLLDEMIRQFTNSDLDYLSNVIEPSFPDGLDIEIVSTHAFRNLAKLNLSTVEREHVTLGLYSRPSQFKIQNFGSNLGMQRERWTVDYPEDLEFIRRVVAFEKTQSKLLEISEVLKYLKNNPEAQNKLSGDLRNEALKDWKPEHD